MSSKTLEIRKYIKQVLQELEELEELSASGAVGAYLTPKAFVGDEEGEPGQKAMSADDVYTLKPSDKKKNFVKIHEISYKQFKEDSSLSDIQKVNKAILEISRSIRNINTVLDHSMKLKNESKIVDSKLWKKTNEALLKINKRMAEAMKKTRKFANLKEIQNSQAKENLHKALAAVGVQVKPEDIEITKQGSTIVIDVYISGEPYGFDIVNDQVYYQDYDKEVSVGYINNHQQLVDGLSKIFK